MQLYMNIGFHDTSLMMFCHGFLNSLSIREILHSHVSMKKLSWYFFIKD